MGLGWSLEQEQQLTNQWFCIFTYAYLIYICISYIYIFWILGFVYTHSQLWACISGVTSWSYKLTCNTSYWKRKKNYLVTCHLLTSNNQTRNTRSTGSMYITRHLKVHNYKKYSRYLGYAGRLKVMDVLRVMYLCNRFCKIYR